MRPAGHLLHLLNASRRRGSLTALLLFSSGSLIPLPKEEEKLFFFFFLMVGYLWRVKNSLLMGWMGRGEVDVYVYTFVCVFIRGADDGWGKGGFPSVSQDVFFPPLPGCVLLHPPTPLPLVSWQKGSCVWLPNDNRERGEGEEVFKRRTQVINDFSCIILAFFLTPPRPHFFFAIRRSHGDGVSVGWRGASSWKRQGGRKSVHIDCRRPL